MKKLLWSIAAFSACLLLVPIAWTGGGKAPTSEEKAIQVNADRLIAAFNKGDAKAVASFWTANGDYMDEGGRRIQGRAAIEAYFQKLFDAGKGARLRIYKTAFRVVRPDLAIGDGVMEVLPPGGGPSTSAPTPPCRSSRTDSGSSKAFAKPSPRRPRRPRSWTTSPG